MQNSLYKGVALSLSLHVVVLSSLLTRSTQEMTTEPEPLTFVTIDLSAPEPIRSKETPKEEILTEIKTPPRQKKSKEEGASLQAKSAQPAAGAPTQNDTAQPEPTGADAGLSALPGPEAGTATEGANPIKGAALAFSAQDFFAIKGELNLPTRQGKIAKGLPMQAIPTFTKSEITAANQSPLGAVAAPFSAYLHAMHLKIHPLWSEGALTQFEGMSAEDKVNDRSMELTIELVLNDDGSLESATPIGSSGDSRYDMAAMYAIQHAAPFPTPPKSLLSHREKVYVRWTLYRDKRECAAILAQPFWITSAERPTPTIEETTTISASPKDEKTKKEKAIEIAKAAAKSVSLTTPTNPEAKSDGFGGVSPFPDHSITGGEDGVMIMIGIGKGKPAGPPVDELSKRK